MTIYVVMENQVVIGVFRKKENALFSILDNVEDNVEIDLLKIGSEIRVAYKEKYYLISKYTYTD